MLILIIVITDLIRQVEKINGVEKITETDNEWAQRKNSDLINNLLSYYHFENMKNMLFKTKDISSELAKLQHFNDDDIEVIVK